MQVSKGLKRATGRDEQVQHHLGTLNFLQPLVISVANFSQFPHSILLVRLKSQKCHPERSQPIRLRMGWRSRRTPGSLWPSGSVDPGKGADTVQPIGALRLHGCFPSRSSHSAQGDNLFRPGDI
jgi:hypothetical protein